MTDYRHHQVTVYDNVGGVTRIAANQRIYVYAPDTTNVAAGLKDSAGNPAPFVTSDAHGQVDFTETSGVVDLVSVNGIRERVVSPDYAAEAVAAKDSAAQSAADAAASAQSAQDSANLVNAPADTAIATAINGPGTQTGQALDDYTSRVSGDSLASHLASLPAWTVGDPLRRVLVKPGTYTYTATLSIPSGVVIDARGATFICNTPGTNDELVGIIGVTDVEVIGGLWDGNKAAFATTTEWRHGFSIVGSSRVKLTDLRVINPKGDGVYIGDDTTGCSDIFLSNVECSGCHRNGLSIVAVDGFTDQAGYYHGAGGTSPESGVAIEPNATGTVITNVKFVGTRCTANNGTGFYASMFDGHTGTQGNIDLIGVTVDGNVLNAANSSPYGMRLRSVDNFKMVGGSVSGNAGPGVRFTGSTSNHVKFSGATISRNNEEGIYVAVPANQLSVVGCTLEGNSAASAGAKDAIQVGTGAVTITGVSLVGNSTPGTQHRYGVRTLAGVSQVSMVGNALGGAAGTESLADDTATRTKAGATGFTTTGGPTSVTRATTGDTGLTVRVSGDTTDRLNIRADGTLLFSSGAASTDVRISRKGVGVVGVEPSMVFRGGYGATASRPAAATAGAGGIWFDTTLGKPIWSTGSAWVDATGTAV